MELKANCTLNTEIFLLYHGNGGAFLYMSGVTWAKLAFCIKHAIPNSQHLNVDCRSHKNKDHVIVLTKQMTCGGRFPISWFLDVSTCHGVTTR